MAYHVELIIAAIIILVITGGYHKYNYYDGTYVSIYFDAMCWCGIGVAGLDLISSLIINFGLAGSLGWIFRLITGFYFMFIFVLIQFLMFYVSVRTGLKHIKKVHIALWTLTSIYSLIYLLLCLFTDKLFFMVGDIYVRGPWQFLSYAPPIVYALLIIAMLLRIWRSHETSSWGVHIALLAMCIFGFVFQLIHERYLVSSFCISLALLMALFTLETPDYKRLKAVLQELSESEAKAQRENENKTQFLRRLSHELRTPLNSVKGAVELMTDHSKKKEEVFEIADAAINSLIYVADEMLDIDKINKGYSYEEREEFSPVEIINRLRDRYLFSILSAGRRLELDAAENLPSLLFGEKRRMMAALQFTLDKLMEWDIDTIFINALGKKGGELFDLNISVKIMLNKPCDEEESIRKYLEELFGLIADVEKTDDTLVITIHFECLIKDATEIGPFNAFVEDKEQRENRLSGPNRKLRVLYVDDNVLNLKVFCGYMKKIGNIEVITATGGREAINIIKSADRDFDIMFLDYMMPEMDGIELFNWIRKESNMKNVPVSALTANAVSGERERFLELGFDEFVSKPYTINHLRDILNKYVS